MKELSDYSETEEAEAEYRLSIIKLMIENNRRSRSQIEQYLQNLDPALFGGRRRPSARTVQRWIKAYQEPHHDVRALVPKQAGPTSSSLPDEVEVIMQQTIREMKRLDEPTPKTRRPRLPDGREIHQEVERRIQASNLSQSSYELPIPSLRTVQRRIEALDPIALAYAQDGEYTTRRKYTQYGQMRLPDAPLERVEIDHTTLDVILVDKRNVSLGRPTITLLKDVATGCVLGLDVSFDPPSYLTVMRACYTAILPKSQICQRYSLQKTWDCHGIPETLVVDNAKEFRGHALKNACASLGIHIEYTPQRTPQAKPYAERIFDNIAQELVHGLDGTTFSNVQSRGDYQSVKEASVQLEDFLEAMYVYIVDSYHQQTQRRANGQVMIPAKAWDQAVQDGFMPPLPVDAQELRILLGWTEERTIQHYGIQLHHLRYNLLGIDNNLAELRASLSDKRVKIKWFPDDLSCIYVFDPRKETYFQVPALDPEYTAGLSYWEHRIIVAETRKDDRNIENVTELAQTRQRIESIVNRSKGSKKLKINRQVERWAQDTNRSGDQNRTRRLPQENSPETPPTPAPQVEEEENLDRWLDGLDEDDAGWETGYNLAELD